MTLLLLDGCARPGGYNRHTARYLVRFCHSRAVSPLTHLALVPIIADVDKQTGNLDPDSLIKNITSRTKAVVVVHMWGVAADCVRIRKICDDNNILMIEDFSQAHFAMCRDSYVGSFGDISFASLQRKKLLSVGEGGIVVTNDQDYYRRLQNITSPGSFNEKVKGKDLDFSGFGLNLRMNPFGAVILDSILEDSDEYIEDRLESIGHIESILSKCSSKIELPILPEYATRPSWYAYKPRLLEGSLDNLNISEPWKLSSFGYPSISSHDYWNKDKNFYPFNLNIQPIIRKGLKGHQEYMRQRFTINIPTVPKAYWTQSVLQEWEKVISKL